MKEMKLQPEKVDNIEVKEEGHVPSMVTFKRF
jgi:hypothetical protein